MFSARSCNPQVVGVRRKLVLPQFYKLMCPPHMRGVVTTEQAQYVLMNVLEML